MHCKFTPTRFRILASFHPHKGDETFLRIDEDIVWFYIKLITILKCPFHALLMFLAWRTPFTSISFFFTPWNRWLLCRSTVKFKIHTSRTDDAKLYKVILWHYTLSCFKLSYFERIMYVYLNFHLNFSIGGILRRWQLFILCFKNEI